MAHVDSVNLARIGVNPHSRARGRTTGINKVPTGDVTMVRSPGPKGSGILGDVIGNQKLHGGDDQAVYAYAREDLDHWEVELARAITNGTFGENLTTVGIDVTRALIGERWRIGTDGPLLEVSAPRTPCRTFAAFLAADQWIKTFTAAAKPGAYLRVLSPGAVRSGDEIAIAHRPDHDVTIEMAFRAKMSEPDLLPQLLAAEALSGELREYARRRAGEGA